MNVSSPDCSEEDHCSMGKVVAWYNGETKNVRASLEHTIKGMKCNRCPWRECLRATVLVVRHVNMLVEKFVGVKCTMHLNDE